MRGSKSEDAVTTSDPLRDADRRRKARTKMASPLYVRPADPADGQFEEVPTTLDFSSIGLRFVTRRKELYRPDMKLYLIPTFSLLNFEYLGRVVRIDPLGQGEYGVAVELERLGSAVVDAKTLANSAFRSQEVKLSGRWLSMGAPAQARPRLDRVK